jgi:hypothetical protein
MHTPLVFLSTTNGERIPRKEYLRIEPLNHVGIGAGFQPARCEQARCLPHYGFMGRN